jgi:hypothetical protein
VAWPHFVQKPLNKSFATEEKGGIDDIENAQSSIWTLSFVKGSSNKKSVLLQLAIYQ